MGKPSTRSLDFTEFWRKNNIWSTRNYVASKRKKNTELYIKKGINRKKREKPWSLVASNQWVSQIIRYCSEKALPINPLISPQSKGINLPYPGWHTSQFFAGKYTQGEDKKKNLNSIMTTAFLSNWPRKFFF